MRLVVISCVLGSGLLAACGAGDDTSDDAIDEMVDCSQEAPHDEFVAGLTKPGSAGHFDFVLMSSNPAPPARGNNEWVLQLNSAGTPMPDAEILVDPYMPKHGHHAGIDAEVTPMATPGQYDVNPVNLWMPGVWEITIDASVNGVSDETVFKFCLPS